jgi:formylglycine-generating enzyme required for sulfatase activity
MTPIKIKSVRDKLWVSIFCSLIAVIFLTSENSITNIGKISSDNEDSPGADLQKTGKDVISIRLPNLPKDAKDLEMVLIQSGTFTMGAPMDERGRNNEYDWPEHKVSITQPFYIGRYEVTQAQWEAIMGGNSHNSKYRGTNHPVTKVSWKKCQRFIIKLNRLGQGTFRLATEAEWESACRSGTETRFAFGDALDCQDKGVENCEIADKYMWWAGNSRLGETREVGLKLPNNWGLYDMHGNVSEWCLDIWQKPYSRDDQTDPSGPSMNWFNNLWPLTNHVVRGGSIYYGGKFKGLQECRSASRFYEQAIDFHYSVGFRLVKGYNAN